MILLRALARLVAFILLVALAVVGLAAAIFSIQGGDTGLSLPGLAELVGLPGLRDSVGDLLAAVEAPGSIAKLSALAGLGALVLGLLLVVGALTRGRERLVVLETEDGGTIAARRRPLGQVAGALAEQVRGVTDTKTKLRPSRRGTGGSIDVTASHPRTAEPGEVKQRATESLAPLVEPFDLKARVKPKLGERGSRVQ